MERSDSARRSLDTAKPIRYFSGMTEEDFGPMTHRCFACSTPVRPGRGDWCPCIGALGISREEWKKRQLEANKARFRKKGDFEL